MNLLIILSLIIFFFFHIGFVVWASGDKSKSYWQELKFGAPIYFPILIVTVAAYYVARS